MERCNLSAELFFQSQQQFTVACMIVIHIRYKNNTRQLILFTKFPCLICTNLYACLAVHYDNRGVCNANCFFYFTNKIEITRRIQQVNLDRTVFTLILQRNQSCGNGELSLNLFLIIIADGVSIGDLSHSADSSCNQCHRLCECRLTRASVAE